MSEEITYEIGRIKVSEMYLMCVDTCEEEYKLADTRDTFNCYHVNTQHIFTDVNRGIRRRVQEAWPLRLTYRRIDHLLQYVARAGVSVDAKELDKMFVHEMLYMAVASHLWSKAHQQQYATILMQLKIMRRVDRKVLLNYGLRHLVTRAMTMDYSQDAVDLSQAPEEVAC